ncbi:MAG: GNAT family protein [Candidatus Nanoarchaeia archaeon]|jgi:ribosomal-protein-serine acetyltransferase
MDATRNARKEGINNDSLIGIISIFKIDKINMNAKVAYWLGEKYQGKGLMSEALDLVLKLAFKDLKLNRVSANVNAENTASKKLLEKHGFKLEGVQRQARCKYKKFYDDLIYGILRKEFKLF